MVIWLQTCVSFRALVGVPRPLKCDGSRNGSKYRSLGTWGTFSRSRSRSWDSSYSAPPDLDTIMSSRSALPTTLWLVCGMVHPMSQMIRVWNGHLPSPPDPGAGVPGYTNKDGLLSSLHPQLLSPCSSTKHGHTVLTWALKSGSDTVSIRLWAMAHTTLQ